MLSKQDIVKVENIVDEKIKTAFQDFWENMLEPYLSKMHEEIKEIRGDVKDTKEQISIMHQHLSNHEKRITRLENHKSVS